MWGSHANNTNVRVRAVTVKANTAKKNHPERVKSSGSKFDLDSTDPLCFQRRAPPGTHEEFTQRCDVTVDAPLSALPRFREETHMNVRRPFRPRPAAKHHGRRLCLLHNRSSSRNRGVWRRPLRRWKDLLDQDEVQRGDSEEACESGAKRLRVQHCWTAREFNLAHIASEAVSNIARQQGR